MLQTSRFPIGHKLNPETAIRAGYRFEVAAPGNAIVTTPAGAEYRVVGFLCNCPDRIHNGGSHDGMCKHEIWVAQLSVDVDDTDDSDPLAGLDVARD